MSLITGGGGASLGSVTSVTGTAASGQVPVASSSAASSWKYPPGFEINYTEITSPVNIVATTTPGTTIISPGAITFDGTAVLVEFFAYQIFYDTAATGDAISVCLTESAAAVAVIYRSRVPITTSQWAAGAYGKMRFTPTAAAHTYTITAFTTSTTGTPAVQAGTSSSGNASPAFVRFTKA